ncbi:MAG: hypothetical protein IJE48_01365, partial [Clostridia bacterium]|nr:hypothetical protein [Clostridia bacterium]
CQINEKNMRRDEGIPPYSCRVLDAGRRVADPYIYFVYVSATLSTVKKPPSGGFFYAMRKKNKTAVHLHLRAYMVK